MAMVERQGGVYGTVEVEEEPQVQSSDQVRVD
jgi:hypothetical protein